MAAEKQTSVKRNAVVATGAIFGSRVFGLVREQVFAFFFGASFVLDAYIAAFRIPNLLRDLFAEGALSQSFTTVFSQKLTTQNDKDAFELANRVTTFLLLLLGGIVILGIVFSPQIVAVIANGFTGEKFTLTVLLNRILFPFILFVALAALMMGMLNAKGRFFLPQSASTFFNITSIIGGLACAYFMAPDYVGPLLQKITGRGGAIIVDSSGLPQAMIGMAIGTLLGGLVQWLVQMPSLMRMGFRPKWNTGFRDPDFLKIMALTVPAIIGAASVQVNVMVNTLYASYLADGSISYLNYSFRFMQFPLGLFGVAIATASAPTLAKMIAQKNENDFRQTMQSSLQMSLFFSLPSTVGLILLATPIIGLIYERGQFSASDTHQTALALMAYSLGIIGYSFIKIYQPAYLAFHDSKTPMRIAIFSIATNAILGLVFVFILHWNHWGLALSTSLVAVMNFVLLAILFSKKMPAIWDQTLLKHAAKCLLASVAMGCAAWFSYNYFARFFVSSNLMQQILIVMIPIAVAVFVYFLTCVAINIQEAKSLVRIIRKKMGMS